MTSDRALVVELHGRAANDWWDTKYGWWDNDTRLSPGFPHTREGDEEDSFLLYYAFPSDGFEYLGQYIDPILEIHPGVIVREGTLTEDIGCQCIDPDRPVTRAPLPLLYELKYGPDDHAWRIEEATYLGGSKAYLDLWDLIVSVKPRANPLPVGTKGKVMIKFPPLTPLGKKLLAMRAKRTREGVVSPKQATREKKLVRARVDLEVTLSLLRGRS